MSDGTSGSTGSLPTPPDPEFLMKYVARKDSRTRFTLSRIAALIPIFVALATGSWWWYVVSLPGLFVIWVTNLAMKLMFRRNCAALPELSAEADTGAPADLPFVSIIAAGRNEEEGIEACVRSLMALDYPCYEVIIVNDHSTDTTPEILRRLEQEFPALRVIHDPPVHPGWQGKSNAIWHAANLADSRSTHFLLTDADVVFHPLSLRRGVELVLREKFDYLTCVPMLECKSLTEQLMLVLNWRSIIVSSRQERIQDPKGMAIGIGAFAMVRKEPYLACGGHGTIAPYQPEDTLLAALMKQYGGHMGVAWTRELVRVRLYRGYRQTMDTSIRKNRINCDDRLRAFFERCTYWVSQYVVPLPVACYSLYLQWNYLGFGLVPSLFTLFAFSAYYCACRELDAARIIAPAPGYIPWLSPVTGLLKLWMELRAIGQIMLRKKMDWRGRDFANARTAKPDRSTP